MPSSNSPNSHRGPPAAATPCSSVCGPTKSPAHSSVRLNETLVGSAILKAEPETDAIVDEQKRLRRTPQFWLILASLMTATFLSALDFTSISIALPTIVKELGGDDFVWVGSAFTLGSTAFIPLSGGLAQIFGRRPVILGSVALFALGSGICGGASSMNVLIAGRTVQGIGGGGILSLTETVVADLVPLKDRGPYIGLISAVWAIASAMGPPIGGGFAASNWRWLFYLNLPLSAVSLFLIAFFFHLKTPQEPLQEKIRKMDWIGNALIIAGSTLTVLGLTWGGSAYPWSSANVLVPLILGLIGLAVFVWYEANIAIEPVIPWRLITNRTSALGYFTTFLHGIITTGYIYYPPVYFQGSLLKGPIGSGVEFFPSSFTIAPGAFACGISVALTHRYWAQNGIGWILVVLGMGLMTLWKVDSSKAELVIFQIFEGLGLGVLFSAPKFAILAPLAVEDSASALALFIFIRSFSQTWGITLGGTILQNQLPRNLPDKFLDALPKGTAIAFAAIPQVKGLAEPLRQQVRDAFAESVRPIWIALSVVGAIGTLSVLGMKELELHMMTDRKWGIEESKPSVQDAEKATPVGA